LLPQEDYLSLPGKPMYEQDIYDPDIQTIPAAVAERFYFPDTNLLIY